MDSPELHTAKDAALKYLARRDHSTQEIRTKLKNKRIPSAVIAEVISWLAAKRLLDDTAFAKRKAEAIYQTKMVGPMYIKMKLKAAGITGQVAEDVVDNLASGSQWARRAERAMMQWKRAHPKHADDKIRQMRFLASRGFTSFRSFDEGEE